MPRASFQPRQDGLHQPPSAAYCENGSAGLRQRRCQPRPFVTARGVKDRHAAGQVELGKNGHSELLFACCALLVEQPFGTAGMAVVFR